MSLEQFLDDAFSKVPNFGIHLYRNLNVADTKKATLSNGPPFRNFQWVKRLKLARCAQPGYNGVTDTPHDISDEQIAYLKRHNFTQIISLNHCGINPGTAVKLLAQNITYRHVILLDFHPVGLVQLTNLVGSIQANGGATLIYCGYGEGRTGNLVSAWAVRQILESEPTFFSKFDWVKLGFFLNIGFGVERPSQYRDVGNYIKSLAPRPVHRRNMTPLNQGVIHPQNIAKIGPAPLNNVWRAYIVKRNIAEDAAYIGNINKGLIVGTHNLDAQQRDKFDKFLRQVNGPLLTASPAPLVPQPLPAPIQQANGSVTFEADNNDGQNEDGNYLTLWEMGSERGLQTFD